MTDFAKRIARLRTDPVGNACGGGRKSLDTTCGWYPTPRKRLLLYGVAIVATAPEDVQRSREAGFADHLTKPIPRERLIESIASVMPLSNSQERTGRGEPFSSLSQSLSVECPQSVGLHNDEVG